MKNTNEWYTGRYNGRSCVVYNDTTGSQLRIVYLDASTTLTNWDLVSIHDTKDIFKKITSPNRLTSSQDAINMISQAYNPDLYQEWDAWNQRKNELCEFIC